MIARPDAEVENDVLRELMGDPRLREAEVNVEVKDTVVVLTGRSSTWSTRAAAEEAAHRVVGVLDVANDIRVIPPGSHYRSDEEIARAVRHTLMCDARVPHDRITSTVSDGIVKLDGEVDDEGERDDAERAVRNLIGVRGVWCRIIVSRKSPC